MEIQTIIAREILDSRGNPTVEAEVKIKGGVTGVASVPSGASTGSREAYERRDCDVTRFAGKGVRSAIHGIQTEIQKELQGCSVAEQENIDARLCALDGTENKSRLGANALLAVSLACARAHAHAQDLPLYLSLHQAEPMCMPIPLMNVLNGGAHADNNVDIQEFMLMPIGALDFPEALRMGVEVFHRLKELLRQRGLTTAIGDEGGFAPNLSSEIQALDLLSLAVEQSGYQLGKDMVFALDVAASEWYHQGIYSFSRQKKIRDSEGMVTYYCDLVRQYPILSIEDGLAEQDWEGWKLLTKQLGATIQLIGDDLFVTNASILQKGIEEEVANAILIKPNQIGTLTETRKAMSMAKKHGYKCIVSHRSGETEDTFIADLAVATGCGQIKTGSLCRTDRVAKYNQLLRIQEASGLSYARYSSLF